MKLLQNLSNSVIQFISRPYNSKFYIYGLECPHGIYYKYVADLKSDTLQKAKDELLKKANLSACSNWIEAKRERYNF